MAGLLVWGGMLGGVVKVLSGVAVNRWYSGCGVGVCVGGIVD